MPRAVGFDPGLGPPVAEEAATPLLIEDPDELLFPLPGRVDVGLVAGDHEFVRVADVLRPVLDARIAADDLEIGLQLEIGDLADPDEEAVTPGDVPVLGVAGAGPVLDGP